MFDVVLQLGDERIDAFELALAAHKVRESHSRRLEVQITGEIDEVRLEQRVIGMLEERGPAAEIERTRVSRAVGTLVPTRVDTVSRYADLIRDLDVGRGETELAPAFVALYNRATHLERMTKHVSRDLYLTTGQGASNRCRTDWFIDTIGTLYEFAWVHLEIAQCTELTQECHIARSLTAKVEILAHYDGAGGQTLDQHTLHKISRAFERLLLIEFDEHRSVHSGSREEFKFLVEISEQLWR